jgi:hypothetical protein
VRSECGVPFLTFSDLSAWYMIHQCSHGVELCCRAKVYIQHRGHITYNMRCAYQVVGAALRVPCR